MPRLPASSRAGSIGERALGIDPGGERLACVRAEIALRLTRIKTFALQRRLDRNADFVRQRLADADQVLLVESGRRFAKRVHHGCSDRCCSGTGSRSGKQAAQLDVGTAAEQAGAHSAEAVIVKRDTVGDAFAQRHQPVEAVEGESVGELAFCLERAQPRRLAPRMQPLARVLVDAETVVIGVSEQNHRFDAAEIGGVDQHRGRFRIVLQVDHAATQQLGLKQIGLGSFLAWPWSISAFSASSLKPSSWRDGR